MAEDNSKKDWPAGVSPISYQGIGRLGVGRDNQLYWDGRPVVTRSRLELSRWQRVVAIVTALMVIAGGLGSCVSGIDAAFNVACKTQWRQAGCKP